MPAKKKSKRVESLRFTPTGKMVILIDMQEAKGPFEFRIDDVDTTLDVMSVIADKLGPSMAVNTFTQKEEKDLTKYVKGE